MQIDLVTLKLGLLFFWAAWLSLVFLSNSLDGLKALGVLPQSWRFSSKNYKAVVKATSIYSSPKWLAGLLFLGVTAWEGLSCALFWRSFQSGLKSGIAARPEVSTAFMISLGLWAAMILADEIFRTYDLAHTHLLIFVAQIVSLLAIYLLPS
jgi:hypothetical protein